MVPSSLRPGFGIRAASLQTCACSSGWVSTGSCFWRTTGAGRVHSILRTTALVLTFGVSMAMMSMVPSSLRPGFGVRATSLHTCSSSSRWVSTRGCFRRTAGSSRTRWAHTILRTTTFAVTLVLSLAVLSIAPSSLRPCIGIRAASIKASTTSCFSTSSRWAATGYCLLNSHMSHPHVLTASATTPLKPGMVLICVLSMASGLASLQSTLKVWLGVTSVLAESPMARYVYASRVKAIVERIGGSETRNREEGNDDGL